MSGTRVSGHSDDEVYTPSNSRVSIEIGWRSKVDWPEALKFQATSQASKTSQSQQWTSYKSWRVRAYAHTKSGVETFCFPPTFVGLGWTARSRKADSWIWRAHWKPLTRVHPWTQTSSGEGRWSRYICSSSWFLMISVTHAYPIAGSIRTPHDALRGIAFSGRSRIQWRKSAAFFTSNNNSTKTESYTSEYSGSIPENFQWQGYSNVVLQTFSTLEYRLPALNRPIWCRFLDLYLCR